MHAMVIKINNGLGCYIKLLTSSNNNKKKQNLSIIDV